MDKMHITANYKGGGSFVSFPPQFASNGQDVFLCSKMSILQCNTLTAQLKHEYKINNIIVGFKYHVSDSYHCLTACSKKGTITTWRTVTHFRVLKQALPHFNVKTFHVIPSENGNYKAIYSYSSKGLIHFAIWDSKDNKSRTYRLSLNKKSPYCIDVTNPNFFAVIQMNCIFVVQINNFISFSRIFIHKRRSFTCITSHPSEEVILTGDSAGRVVGWHDLFSGREKQTVFHWHTLPVKTVSFSDSGSYFYSGGSECVLVKWQFENVEDKRFVPRLPAEIVHITVSKNNQYVAVSTIDNAVRILDNTLNQVSLIQHLVLATHFDGGIVHDGRSRSLILNGNEGHIQFYSPDDMSLLYSVDIVGQNKITNERNTDMTNTEITKVAISKSGLWFSTVEERRDEEYSNEIRLKFWKFDESNQQFHLNTSIEYPHENSINSMLFQPLHKDDSLRCITVGDDKKFKIWQVIESAVLSSTQMTWKCSGAGFYRDLPCKSLSFSVDGSLFSTGFGEILTVWTPDSCILRCQLIHPFHKETLKHIFFGKGNQCHFLVAGSDSQISVWNILTLSMTWTVPINVSFLIADSLSSNMAVITASKKVIVFSPDSSTPIYTNNTLLSKFESITACNFVPSKNSNDLRLNWYDRNELYFITSNNELYCLSESKSISESTPDQFIEDKSMYAMITPQVKSGTVQATAAQTHLYEKDLGHKMIKTYLESPLHTLAPIRFASYSLLKSLVVQEET